MTYGRRFLVVLAFALMVFFPIGSAYAYDGGGGGSHNFGGSYPSFGTIWWGPRSTASFGGTSNLFRVGVVAYTKYDAAMYALGVDPEDERLTNKKKAKLIASSNDFTAFANTFNVGKPELQANPFVEDEGPVVAAWFSARELYGETFCYSSLYEDDVFYRALRYLESVLDEDDTPSGGGTGGGGTGSGSSDVSMRIPLYYVGNGDAFAGEQCTLELNSAFVASFQSYLDRDSKKYWAVTINQNSGDINIWVADHDWTLWMDDDGNIDYFAFDESATIANSLYGHNYTYSNGTVTLNATGFESPWSKSLRYDSSIRKYVYGQSNVSYCSDKSRSGSEDGPVGGGGDGGGGGDDDPEPPETWPQPPVDPYNPTDPPVVPDPPDPTPPDPPDPYDPYEPVDPTPPDPWDPYPTDDFPFTGDDVQAILDALNEHCIHLQEAIAGNISQLWSKQNTLLSGYLQGIRDDINGNFSSLTSWLEGTLDWLGNDIIYASFDDLKTYLHELFEWLAERMNFNISVEGGQYDDTSVIYWMKRIWSKLGSGDINTRPTDPVQDPGGWWDWLTRLLNDLAANLMMLGQDKLADLVETLNSLRSKFPFSLPWDIAALLGLLVAPAQTPEFDVPLVTVTASGLQTVGSYHVSLQAYDGAWNGVRWIETIAFAVYLLMNTGSLGDMVKRTVRPR